MSSSSLNIYKTTITFAAKKASNSGGDTIANTSMSQSLMYLDSIRTTTNNVGSYSSPHPTAAIVCGGASRRASTEGSNDRVVRLLLIDEA